jgi:glutathione reductase (NADPH)
VGLLERSARDRGHRFSARHEDTSGWFASRRIGERCAGHEVLVEEGTGRIRGAHLLGAGAEETINLFAMAMRAGLSAPAISDLLFAYPTQASNVHYML